MIATAAIDPRDQIVGRGQRPQALIDAGPDCGWSAEHLMQHGVDGRQLVLQPVLQLLDHELAVFFLLDQPLRNLSLLPRPWIGSARRPIS